MSEVSGRGRVKICSATELEVYKRAYKLSMDIFLESKKWPQDERYSLIDQVRRSSRSVCANLREAWAKRRYEMHFISKITDCDAENSETDTWLDYAHNCGYLSDEQHRAFKAETIQIGMMIGAMLKTPESFLLRKQTDDDLSQ